MNPSSLTPHTSLEPHRLAKSAATPPAAGWDLSSYAWLLASSSRVP